jgi:hypothetical protein
VGGSRQLSHPSWAHPHGAHPCAAHDGCTRAPGALGSRLEARTHDGEEWPQSVTDKSYPGSGQEGDEVWTLETGAEELLRLTERS